jgi:hypothetical protein
MALPTSLQTCVVHGHYLELDGDPAQGTVTFTGTDMLDSQTDDLFIIPVAITVELDANGEFNVTLPCTDDPDALPVSGATSWRYKVKEQFGTWSREYWLEVPTSVSPGPIDLAVLVPLPTPGNPTYSTEYVRSLNGETGAVTLDAYDLGEWDRTAGPYRVPESIPGDGGTDVSVELTSWLAGLPNGATATFKSGKTYFIGGLGIRLTNPVTIECNGATFKRAPGTGVNAGPIFDVQSNYVTIRNGNLVGPGDTPYAADHRGSGVYLLSPSWAAHYKGLVVEGCTITDWGFAGVWVEWAEQVTVQRNRFERNSYANCHFNSVWTGKYNDNWGGDLSDSGNQISVYGFAANRWAPYSLANAPRCRDIEVKGNFQINTKWECFDTHAGENIHMHHNKSVGKIGYAIVTSDDEAGIQRYAPQFCTVESNTHDGGVADGSMSFAITFTGAENIVGTPNELAVGGKIINNVVRNAGTGNDTKNDAMYIHDTRGLIISGNQIIEPATGGIQIYHDNYGLQCRNNYIEEAWTNAATTPFTSAIRVRNNSNSMLLEGNIYAATGARTGAVLRNQRGFYLPSATNNTIYKGWNDFSGAATPWSPITSVAYTNMYA